MLLWGGGGGDQWWEAKKQDIACWIFQRGRCSNGEIEKSLCSRLKM